MCKNGRVSMAPTIPLTRALPWSLVEVTLSAVQGVCRVSQRQTPRGRGTVSNTAQRLSLDWNVLRQSKFSSKDNLATSIDELSTTAGFWKASDQGGMER